LRAASKPVLLRPVIATRAPSSKNRRAVSNPIPLVPPVIRARFPWSLGMTEDCIKGVKWKHVRAEADLAQPGDLHHDDGSCRAKNLYRSFRLHSFLLEQ